MWTAWLAVALLPPAAHASGVEAGAEVTATARVGTHGCMNDPGSCEWIDFRDAAVVSPWVSASPNDSVQARAHIDLRLHGPGDGHGLESQVNTQPWSLRVRDAWVAARGQHTELKIGAQRIAWGVANGVSVVDTINPLNLENPTQFDQRLSLFSGVATAHTETLSLSGIVAPFFVPAALPSADVDLMSTADDLLSSSVPGAGDITLGELASRPTAPSDSIKNTTVGVQLRWTPAAGDFALSWHHGRDSLPQVNGDILLVGYQTNTNAIDVGVPLTYPKIDVLGFTARAPLFAELTGWLETAVTFPEATSAAPSLAQLDGLTKLGTIEAVPDPIPITTTQDGAPILKWIIGVERPFGPLRVTGQWMHGFFTERSQADVRDYALLGLRWTITDVVRLDANGASNFDGHLVNLGCTFLHADTVELSFGTTHIDGTESSAFGGLGVASNLYSRATMRF